jgi:hypothetical protein
MRHLSVRLASVRRFAVLSLMVVMPLGACASAGTGSHMDRHVTEGSSAWSGAPTSVVVMNRSWDRVTVYVAQGTIEWRLGDVEPMSERTLALNNVGVSLLGRSANFVGRRLAGGTFRSEAFNVMANGGVPHWTIENYAAYSYVMMR